MEFLRSFRRYDEAEDFANQYKGDTRTADPIHVVEDFDPGRRARGIPRFHVVRGAVPEHETILGTGETRYVIQFTATLAEQGDGSEPVPAFCLICKRVTERTTIVCFGEVGKLDFVRANRSHCMVCGN